MTFPSLEPQQVLLRDAMQRLNMTRDQFAARIGVRKRSLDAWLLPDTSSEFRNMPTLARQFITELVSQQPPQPSAAQPPAREAPKSTFFQPDRAVLLSVDQFSREAVDHLFRIADQMRPIASRQKITRVLEGAVLGNLFFEASTRTRVSFGAAFCRLGGAVCDTTGFTFSSMAKGESIADTSRVVSGYVDVLVVRHPQQGAVAAFAKATHIPVINAGDGPGEHPTQALLDLYTIQREFVPLGRPIDGCHVAMLGDLRFGRTVHSLIKLLSLYRQLHFTLIAPQGLQMPAELVEFARQRGHEVSLHFTPQPVERPIDVLYTTRLQRERLTDELLEGMGPAFCVDDTFVATFCAPQTVIMHPLPRDSREGANDLSERLDNDARLAIFRQTDNGIPVRMAIFAMMLGVDHLVPSSMRDAPWRLPHAMGGQAQVRPALL